MIKKFFKSKSLDKEQIWLSFKKLYILFWLASFIGHYLEVIWARTLHVALGYTAWHPEAPTIMPLAPPYGFGAVAVVLLIWPLIKRYKLNLVGSFFMSVVVTGFVEYLCGLFLVLVTGRNIYWDYGDRFLNIGGQVCLQSSLIFGFVAVNFLYFVYPHYEKFIDHFNKKQFNVIFWLLFASYVIDLIFICMK